jgi:hypothetical protein
MYGFTPDHDLDSVTQIHADPCGSGSVTLGKHVDREKRILSNTENN